MKRYHYHIGVGVFTAAFTASALISGFTGWHLFLAVPLTAMCCGAMAELAGAK